ncbi:MAG: CopG family transcriptional regulator [Betaproteobacteria bacterium]|nr:CopG family transcriptional regulator [Betaproteobacteria bacterium]
MAVSLRLPEKTKRRVEKLARAQETTAHAFMVTAIEERIAAEEAKTAFYAEAEKRAAQFRKTGKSIPADEMFDYLRARVQGKSVAKPKARKVA